MNLRRVLLWAMLALVLVVSGYFIYNNYFEWVEVEIEGPMSVQARKHDMLAATRYLEQLGLSAERIEDSDFFSQLSPSVNTILLQTLPETLPAEAYNRLLYWVEQGGHLMVGLGDNHNDATYEFYQSLGLTPTHEFDNTAESYSLVVDGVDDDARLTATMELDYLFTLWAGTPVSINMRLQDLFAFAQMEYGAGHVTAFADDALWSNERIGSSDNARLLAASIGRHATVNSIIYVSDTNTSLPGVFTMVWQRWQWFCLVMMALGLALLRRASVRFGPIHTDAETRSNNFARHLLAVAQFQGRYLSFDYLLGPARQRVLNKYVHGGVRNTGVVSASVLAGAANDESSLELAAQPSGAPTASSPIPAPVDNSEFLNRVHQRSGLPVEAIDRALFHSANKATILPIVSTLQAIERRVENNAE